MSLAGTPSPAPAALSLSLLLAPECVKASPGCHSGPGREATQGCTGLRVFTTPSPSPSPTLCSLQGCSSKAERSAAHTHRRASGGCRGGPQLGFPASPRNAQSPPHLLSHWGRCARSAPATVVGSLTAPTRAWADMWGPDTQRYTACRRAGAERSAHRPQSPPLDCVRLTLGKRSTPGHLSSQSQERLKTSPPGGGDAVPSFFLLRMHIPLQAPAGPEQGDPPVVSTEAFQHLHPLILLFPPLSPVPSLASLFSCVRVFLLLKGQLCPSPGDFPGQ